jgi:sulfite reductase subunit B
MARVVIAEKFTEREQFFRLAFEDGFPFDYKPGQFVEVSVFGRGEAPISICSSPTQKGSFELCVRAVGDLTNALHTVSAGGVLGIRGPFGNGFNAESARGQDVLFVAGGLGLAPTRSFIKYVIDNRSQYGKVTILVGARSPQELLFKEDLKEWQARPDVDCLVTVDRSDGSWKGNIGLITSLFSKISIAPTNTVAVIVGPPIMFKFAVLEALSEGVPENRIVCSLERRMKCGIGKCGHCQIRNIYVCQEGPVFTYAQVKRLREGI